MKPSLLLLCAALVPVTLPSPAQAHDFCFSTSVPDADCNGANGQHTCVSLTTPFAGVVCFGLHS